MDWQERSGLFLFLWAAQVQHGPAFKDTCMGGLKPQESLLPGTVTSLGKPKLNAYALLSEQGKEENLALQRKRCRGKRAPL